MFLFDFNLHRESDHKRRKNGKYWQEDNGNNEKVQFLFFA
jgi:hypothetical protein